MPSGGHARVGPPPDPNALRRDRPGDHNIWRHLPAAGRQGHAPPWPLATATARELLLWEREWHRPQAVMWEAHGQQMEVANLVRTQVRFEQADASVAVGSLLRGQMTDLGLNEPGLRCNRWLIDVAGPVASRITRSHAPDRGSAKARFQKLEGGRTA